MNESTRLVLKYFTNCWVIVANIDLSSTSLQVQVTVALVIEEILHMSLSDN